MPQSILLMIVYHFKKHCLPLILSCLMLFLKLKQGLFTRVLILSEQRTLYGHAWVLDGHIYRDENSSLKSYLHINWGWNGDRDGYYECGVFDTTAGSFKDEEIDSNTSLDSGGVEANYFWTYRIVTYDLP